MKAYKIRWSEKMSKGMLPAQSRKLSRVWLVKDGEDLGVVYERLAAGEFPEATLEGYLEIVPLGEAT